MRGERRVEGPRHTGLPICPRAWSRCADRWAEVPACEKRPLSRDRGVAAVLTPINQERDILPE